MTGSRLPREGDREIGFGSGGRDDRADRTGQLDAETHAHLVWPSGQLQDRVDYGFRGGRGTAAAC
jgi:hypothetical protein